MIRNFERIALVAAGGLVSGLVAVATLNPPQTATAVPKAVLDMPRLNHSAALKINAETGSQRFLPIKARQSEALLAGIAVRALQDHRPSPENSAERLDRTFAEMGYDLDRVRDGIAAVPRVFLASMPDDLDEVREVHRKKAIFFRAALPLILQANEEIRADRARLLSALARLEKGERLAPKDRLWLIVMAERYKVERGAWDELVERVDIIPVSLALAQAAEESGWGTSRFAREGNAMFGQWTTESGEGLVPKDREVGKTHKVKSFDNLLQSARAYALNLNTHLAYRKLRSVRQEKRRKNEAVKGYHLIDTLTGYSERGDAYVKSLRAIIAANKLRLLDEARLSTGA